MKTFILLSITGFSLFIGILGWLGGWTENGSSGLDLVLQHQFAFGFHLGITLGLLLAYLIVTVGGLDK